MATGNGNQLVAEHVEVRITEGGVFYPITPSTEGGEIYQAAFADGKFDVWGNQKIAIETEGEHAAQGGATALAVTGRRVVNFTSGQGLAYAMEHYYHAPGKASTMVLQVGARALTKHALNVHCAHDDMLVCITQDDVVKRKVFDKSHRAYVPDFEVYIIAEIGGKKQHVAVSRQVVLFCIERRKAWRLLQSKAGVANTDYEAQRSLLAKVDKGEIAVDEMRAKGAELLAAEKGA